jgi:hypothetical protein
MKRAPRSPSSNLPATLNAVEKAALDAASNEFAWWRANGSPWSSDSALSPQAGHAMMQSFLALGCGDVTSRLRLIQAARLGLADARAVLQRLILEYQTRGEPMPTEIAAYDMEVKTLGGPTPWGGPKRAARMSRDLVITTVTLAVVDTYQLPRTKRSAKHQSACEIVALALGHVGIAMGHKGVEKIVERYRAAWPAGQVLWRPFTKNGSYGD